jgi:hypothetical protein
MASLVRLERAGLVSHESRGEWIVVAEAPARDVGGNPPHDTRKAQENRKANGGNPPPGAADGKRGAKSITREAELPPALAAAPKPAPAPKPAGWIEPLSGAHKARHAAGGRVRDEMTLAGA